MEPATGEKKPAVGLAVAGLSMKLTSDLKTFGNKFTKEVKNIGGTLQAITTTAVDTTAKGFGKALDGTAKGFGKALDGTVKGFDNLAATVKVNTVRVKGLAIEAPALVERSEEERAAAKAAAQALISILPNGYFEQGFDPVKAELEALQVDSNPEEMDSRVRANT